VVRPASRRIPRVRRYSRFLVTGTIWPFAYGPLTLYGAPFQRASAPTTSASEPAAAASTRTVQPRSDIAGRLYRHHGLGSSPFARRY
jgi:hypothetical protein